MTAIFSTGATTAATAVIIAEMQRAQAAKCFYLFALKEKKMDTEILTSFLGKIVTVKTIGDYAEGVLKEVRGDFLVIANPKNAEKVTLVNAATVETIKIKK